MARNMRARLRELLAQEGIVMAPGCYDSCGAAMAEAAGFRAVSMGGNSTGASMFGIPDVGTLTLSEITQRARQAAAAVSIPLICDADTGYGGERNIIRTVREFEAIGVAGIHLEDQTWPKVCPAIHTPSVVDRREAAERIETACRAREDDDFVIVARTDAFNQHGLEEAIARGNLLGEAGADLIYIEGLQQISELEAVCRGVHHGLCVHVAENRAWSGITADDLGAMGFKLAIYGVAPGMFVTQALREYMVRLAGAESPCEITNDLMSGEELTAILKQGASQVQ